MTSHTVEALDNPRVRVTAQLGPGGPELEHRCDRGQLSGTAPLHASRMRVLELASFRAPHLQLACACGCHCTPCPPWLSVQIPQTAPSEGLSRLFFNQASDSRCCRYAPGPARLDRVASTCIPLPGSR